MRLDKRSVLVLVTLAVGCAEPVDTRENADNQDAGAQLLTRQNDDRRTLENAFVLLSQHADAYNAAIDEERRAIEDASNRDLTGAVERLAAVLEQRSGKPVILLELQRFRSERSAMDESSRAIEAATARVNAALIACFDWRLEDMISGRSRAMLQAALLDLSAARAERRATIGRYHIHQHSAHDALDLLAAYERDAGSGTMFQEAQRSWIRLLQQSIALMDRSNAYLEVVTASYPEADDWSFGRRDPESQDPQEDASARAREKLPSYAAWRRSADDAMLSPTKMRRWRANEEKRQRAFGYALIAGRHFEAIDVACAKAEAQLGGTIDRVRER